MSNSRMKLAVALVVLALTAGRLRAGDTAPPPEPQPQPCTLFACQA